MLTIELNPTITGGTPVTLNPVGLVGPGKSRWLFPTHTHLKPNMVDLTTVSPVVTNADAGQASALVKLTVANREKEAGCCTVTSGQMIFDLKVRFAMNQDQAVIGTLGFSEFRALVSEPGLLESMVYNGILPQ